jgi:hypothetical protein
MHMVKKLANATKNGAVFFIVSRLRYYLYFLIRGLSYCAINHKINLSYH